MSLDLRCAQGRPKVGPVCGQGVARVLARVCPRCDQGVARVWPGCP